MRYSFVKSELHSFSLVPHKNFRKKKNNLKPDWKITNEQTRQF